MNSAVKVYFGTPQFELSGVNTLNANLIRALQKRGIEAAFLITGPLNQDYYPLAYDDDLPLIHLESDRSLDLKKRWQSVIDFLETHAPCIYVPGYDYQISCISSALSDRVGILGVLYSDEDLHYDHVLRLGAFWNKIIGISDYITYRVKRDQPDSASRVIQIPCGVPDPGPIDRCYTSTRPIRLVYAGRLIQYQKRIMDLVAITRQLKKESIPYHLTVIGDGPERELLMKSWTNEISGGQVEIRSGVSHKATLESFKNQDVFLLPSEFEGLPLALLEAMAAGCIPVVADIRSGIPELIESGTNGWIVKTGNSRDWAGIIGRLHRRPELAGDASRRAVQMVRDKKMMIDSVADSYRSVLLEIYDQIIHHRFQRRLAPIYLPVYLNDDRVMVSMLKKIGKRVQKHCRFLQSSGFVGFIRRIVGMG
ncbi:MAG: glycosyltransferase family 4 protein [Candidatus Delongbacteria bacterium]|nr:glycosyltransferase family 4 protein [Candidatus Delongbacteria bacterium]